MAYLSDFAFDIFISYANVDNLTASGSSPGWVTQFHQQLKVYLWKRVGRAESVKIWRDHVLDGNQLFDRTIQDRVESAALFLALTSTGYLASDYCRRELDCFYQKAQASPGGLAVGDRLRICNVLLNNIPISKWPEEFSRSGGFKFHDSQQDDDLGNPIDPADKAFQPALRHLGDSIYRTLCDLMAATPRKKEPSFPEKAAFTVYVADTADSLRMARKRLINELQQQKGTTVITNIPPPYEPRVHEQHVREALKMASLSVHLLDGLSGREIEGQPGLCYPQAQTELAIGHGKAPFIWVPQQLTEEAVEDEAYKQFLGRLENGPRTESKYEFVRGAPSTITRDILQKMEELRSLAAPRQASPAAALLDTHFKDQLHTLELSKFLLDRQVIPLINPAEDDPRRNLKLFEERLKQVSLLIIFYGSVAEEWVRARLAAALQIAIAQNCPLKACGVYLAPPRKASANFQLGQRLFPVELMDHTDRFNAGSVAPLLERMN
jgi:hypothetical protein